jgi:hypothetical protein
METKRLATGLLVTGTAQTPVIYVLSSDPRIGGGEDSLEKNIDSNSGILHRLTANGAGGYARVDLVRGLPRSEENHSGNGMALSTDGSTLFLAYGGNTNMGAPSNNFVYLPEYALSAAILSVDLGAIGNSTYDLPTLDDEDRENVCSAGNTSITCTRNSDCDTSQSTGDGICSSEDVRDPFGGNQGKNQAKLVPGGPVQVFAPGFRNPYDVLIMENGRMYSIDNGPNAGWGDVPLNEGPAGNCTNAIREPGLRARTPQTHSTARILKARCQEAMRSSATIKPLGSPRTAPSMFSVTPRMEWTSTAPAISRDNSPGKF